MSHSTQKKREPRSHTSNTSTFLYKERADRKVKYEKEIQEIYSQIGDIDRQKKIHETAIQKNSKDDDDELESEKMWRNYETAFMNKSKCIKDIDQRRERIKKIRLSISELPKAFKGGRRRRTRKGGRYDPRIGNQIAHAALPAARRASPAARRASPAARRASPAARRASPARLRVSPTARRLLSSAEIREEDNALFRDFTGQEPQHV